MANVISPALVSGETRVEPATPEHTGSVTATKVICCSRGGCVRGRPPLHEGATRARRRSKIFDFRDHERRSLSDDTASYPEGVCGFCEADDGGFKLL